MIDSVVKASEFNLDFKRDFDYGTYLLIVGQKTDDNIDLDSMIGDADRVIEELKSITNTGENFERLELLRKYLGNLESYIDHIRSNLKGEENYDENMQIWENDVQVGTSLLQESFYQYIYYEIRDLEKERKSQEVVFARIITGTVVAYIVVVILILVVSYYFNSLLRQVRKEQRDLRKAELLVLQSQINPHFLYNTLDAITWLAESGEEETVVKMVDSLSGFFRSSLSKGKDVVTLAEDLHHVRSYLEIQKIRYQDILDYKIEVPEEYGDISIPKITIQPLVENALYHGIKNKRGGGSIVITGRTEGDDLIIEVTDDGVGMDAERLVQVREGINEQTPGAKGVYGLDNVNERIRLYFGDRYGIVMESEEGVGTCAAIRLPYK